MRFQEQARFVPIDMWSVRHYGYSMSVEGRIEFHQDARDTLTLQITSQPSSFPLSRQSHRVSLNDVLQIERGTLYPALHRLLKRKWITAEHGISERVRAVLIVHAGNQEGE